MKEIIVLNSSIIYPEKYWKIAKVCKYITLADDWGLINDANLTLRSQKTH